MVLDFDGEFFHKYKSVEKLGAKAKYMQKVIGVVVGVCGWTLTTFQRLFNGSSTALSLVVEMPLRFR